MVRAVYLKLKPDQVQDANSAKIQVRWDGADNVAVDLPLDYFYCRGKTIHPIPLAGGGNR